MQSIIALIRSKTADKTDRIIKEAELIKNHRLKEAEEQGAQIEKSILENANNALRSQLIRFEAGAKLRARHALLKAKEELMQEILDNAQNRLREMTSKPEYSDIVVRLVVDAVLVLDAPELEVIFPDGHKTDLTPEVLSKTVEKMTSRKIKFHFSDEKIRASGGVIIRTPDRKKWVDNTFESRFERMYPEIRERAASILFGESK